MILDQSMEKALASVTQTLPSLFRLAQFLSVSPDIERQTNLYMV